MPRFRISDRAGGVGGDVHTWLRRGNYDFIPVEIPMEGWEGAARGVLGEIVSQRATRNFNEANYAGAGAEIVTAAAGCWAMQMHTPMGEPIEEEADAPRVPTPVRVDPGLVLNFLDLVRNVNGTIVDELGFTVLSFCVVHRSMDTESVRWITHKIAGYLRLIGIGNADVASTYCCSTVVRSRAPTLSHSRYAPRSLTRSFVRQEAMHATLSAESCLTTTTTPTLLLFVSSKWASDNIVRAYRERCVAESMRRLRRGVQRSSQGVRQRAAR